MPTPSLGIAVQIRRLFKAVEVAIPLVVSLVRRIKQPNEDRPELKTKKLYRDLHKK